MKRVLISFTTLFVIGMLSDIFFQSSSYILQHKVLIFAVLIVLSSVLGKTKVAIISVILFGFVSGSVYYNIYNEKIIKPIEMLAEKEIKTTATVIDFPKVYDDTIRVEIKIENKQKFNSLLYLPIEYKDIEPGDTISASFKFYEPTIYDGFDRKTYYKSKGIYTLTSYNQDEPLTLSYIDHKPIWAYPKYASRFVSNTISTFLDERQSGLLSGILIGDKTNLSDYDYSNIQKVGIAHVIAVSGMHVGFLVSFLIMILGRKFGSIISLFAIVFFCIMTGATPSVMRASIMYILVILSFFINKEEDKLTSLSFALLIILVLNPASIFHVGLQLSFAATLGIVALCSRMQNKANEHIKLQNKILKKMVLYIISSFICSFSAMVFTIPLLIYHFGYISILSPISSLLLMWAIGIVFILGYLICIFAIFSTKIATLIALPVKLLIDFIFYVIEWLASFDFSILRLDSKQSIIFVIVLYTVIVLCCILKKQLKYILPTGAVAIIICFINCITYNQQIYQVSILPSGYGQAILFAQDDKLTLIDCSGSGNRNSAKSVQDWMDWYGYDKIHTLVLTSIDKTHCRDVPELLENINVEQVIIPEQSRNSEIYNEVISAIENNNIPVVQYNDTIAIKNDSIKIIDDIDRKLIVDININNQSILIAHSLTQKMMNEYLEDNGLNCDILVLNSNNINDAKMLEEMLFVIKPDEIILQSAYESADALYKIPVKNTFTQGELIIK